MLSSAIFDRLMAGNDVKENLHAITGGTINSSKSAAIGDVVVYLFQCFLRLRKEQKTLSTEDWKACADVILVNARTSLQTPDVYEGQDPLEQLFGVCFDAVRRDEDAVAFEFFGKILEVRIVRKLSFALDDCPLGIKVLKPFFPRLPSIRTTTTTWELDQRLRWWKCFITV